MLTISHGSAPAFWGNAYTASSADSMANPLDDIVPVHYLPSYPSPQQQWSDYGFDTDVSLRMGSTPYDNVPEAKTSTAASAALPPMKPSSSSLYGWDRLPGQPALSTETSVRGKEVVIQNQRPNVPGVEDPRLPDEDRSNSTQKPSVDQESCPSSPVSQPPHLSDLFTRVPLDKARKTQDPLREGVEFILDLNSSSELEQGVSTTREVGPQPDQSEVAFDSKLWDRIARPTKIADYKQAPCSKKSLSMSKKAIAYREAQRRASDGQETDPAPKSSSGKRKRSDSDSDLSEEGSSKAVGTSKRRRIEE